MIVGYINLLNHYSELPVEIGLNPMRTDEGEFVLISVIDITERKRAEEALQEANRNKEVFLATLAHELRNPLAPVRSGLEIMRRSLDDKAKVEQTLEIVERQAAQLYRLVDDLLDISRITHGKIKLQKSRIALSKAVEIALETSRGFIEKQGCRLTVTVSQELIYLDADLTRLAQVILNLLNNAAKYNRPKGSIWLRAERGDNEAVITVSDSGIGISSEFLLTIFEPYTQIDNDEQQLRGGIGIGLNVVKRLVEKHGGSITAASEGKDKGSEFVVRLPLAAEQEFALPADQNAGEEKMMTSVFGSRRVLVVDDNSDAAQMLEYLLTTENHKVRTANNGRDALTVADKFEPEIVLLDIGLPDLSGYEVARRLRQKNPASLLIAVSGWGQEEDRQRSLEAGFDYHLVKPVEFDELWKLLNRASEK
jgi:signal transduction histidine kinase/CheY-like chemotaxis protein